MNKLTKEQLEFLQIHDLPLDKVFDATGYSQKEYRVIMKTLGKQIAYNVTPCKQSGHTLRTRSGHCIQCNPAAIAFIKRNDSEGVVYIAGTIKGGIIKIGFTKDSGIRDESLNRTVYAGFKDWTILFALKSPLGGQIEKEIKNVMLPYSREFDYNHDGHIQEAGETFTCSYSKAKNSLLDLCNSRNYEITIQKNFITENFEFRNLKRIK